MYARLYLGIEVKWRLICFGRVDAVTEPQLPRKRRAPARKKVGDSGAHYFPSTPKEHFRHVYYSAIDVMIECIRTRFNQKYFKVYQSIQ